MTALTKRVDGLVSAEKRGFYYDLYNAQFAQ